jgi:hypothetical protein
LHVLPFPSGHLDSFSSLQSFCSNSEFDFRKLKRLGECSAGKTIAFTASNIYALTAVVPSSFELAHAFPLLRSEPIATWPVSVIPQSDLVKSLPFLAGEPFRSPSFSDHEQTDRSNGAFD